MGDGKGKMQLFTVESVCIYSTVIVYPLLRSWLISRPQLLPKLTKSCIFEVKKLSMLNLRPLKLGAESPRCHATIFLKQYPL